MGGPGGDSDHITVSVPVRKKYVKNSEFLESLQLALLCLPECVCASSGLHETRIHLRTELPASVSSSLDSSYCCFLFQCLSSPGLLGACPIPTLSSEVTTPGGLSWCPQRLLQASCVPSVHRVEPCTVMSARLSPALAFSPKPITATGKIEGKQKW